MSTEQTDVKKTLFTPFNIVVGLILLLGGIVTLLRFTKGLGRGHQPFG